MKPKILKGLLTLFSFPFIFSGAAMIWFFPFYNPYLLPLAPILIVTGFAMIFLVGILDA